MLMRRTGDTPLFYVYLTDGSVQGPMSFDAIQRCDAETLVRVEGGEVWWPRRRWNAKGELNVAPHEHYQAWVWLLAFAPVLAWFFAPGLIRAEWGIAWGVVIGVAFTAMMMCKRDVPRFPVE